MRNVYNVKVEVQWKAGRSELFGVWVRARTIEHALIKARGFLAGKIFALAHGGRGEEVKRFKVLGVKHEGTLDVL